MWAGLVLASVLAVLAPAVPPVFAADVAAPVPEYNAKAGYLLLFTRYVTWPDSVFASADAPIVIGVLGENPFGDVLERTVRGLKSQGRPVAVRLVRTAHEAAGCQVVFIARGQERAEADWLAALRDKPVLTVTESDSGLASGAVLLLNLERTLGGIKVTFFASLPAARAAGLRISSSMLASARKVYRESTLEGLRR